MYFILIIYEVEVYYSEDNLKEKNFVFNKVGNTMALINSNNKQVLIIK